MEIEKNLFNLTIKAKKQPESVFVIPQIEGGNAYCIKLNSELANQYIGYILIKNDLQKINKYFEILLEADKNNLSDEIRNCIYLSSIMIYSRLFKDASQGRKIKLDKRDWINGIDDELIKQHDENIHIRDQFIGHAGSTNHLQADLYLFIPVDENKNVYSYQVNSVETQYKDDSFITNTQLLIKHIEKKLSLKIELLEKKLHNEIISVPINERREIAKKESEKIILDPNKDKFRIIINDIPPALKK